MKKNLCCSIIILITLIQPVFSQAISIHFDKTSPQQQYAVSTLEKALLQKKYSIKAPVPAYQINLILNPKSLSPESFTINPAGKTITITGADERGLIYGCLSLAEDIRNGISLIHCKSKDEKPFLPFRAIKYDLPWDTYRHSYALELHDQTCRDTSYWKAFLDMMAENRFNALSFWNLHPYTFLIKPKNFPEASPWNDAAMKEWQALFHSITRMALERAVDV
ncbi:MAG TPA: glycoside hydrolase family 20 zincin-like fold domain-containing protein, partial [Chitinophagaceae bacterium]|nr:glycoside hydrolase family 20 zincin-like fold domain-containing protein [Chitinophagaceae bacterium]